MRDAYLREFRHVARQALSLWNREPASGSAGSFDRRWWGWKYKDFGDATLQYAARIAVAYAEEAGQTAALPEWLELYVRHVTRIQHADGSFDQCYPYERTPGVVHDFLSTLIDIWSGPYLSTAARSQLEAAISRAADFAVRHDEVHGEIANHLAQYAYECLYHARHFDDARTRAKGQAYLDRTLSLLDRDEGWLREYDGADPGYQTRTLRYLAKCAALLDSEPLWDVVRKAADYMSVALMPDGSVHPMLGCRSTALLYPSGIELFAKHDARYEPLARRVRHAWSRGLCPLPAWLDFENAIRLADDALDAARVCPPEATAELPAVETEPPRVHLERAGLLVFRDSDRVIHVQHRLGGVVVVYGKTADGWRLLHEDSGYVLRDSGNVYVTRMPSSGELRESSSATATVNVDFFRSLHEDLTPLQMIALRVLNLTLLRWSWSAELFRRVVVKRLMTGRNTLATHLTRKVRLEDGRVVIEDAIHDERREHSGELLHCRRVVGVHMASSRYFQEQELRSLPLAWAEPVSLDAQGRATRALTVETPSRALAVI